MFAKPGTYDDADPISVLDVDISSRLILDEILGIKDLRSDKRIDFVGGLRGLGEFRLLCCRLWTSLTVVRLCHLRQLGLNLSCVAV
ncbi:Uncharacterized conserved protein [Segatella copri]|nr:Uncharacterized conserved protein [Segatella copri]